MEFIYYTIAAIVLYVVSDFILNRIEIIRGKRLPNRSFIFLIIIMALSIGSFNLLQSILVPIEPAQTTPGTQVKQPNEVPTAISPARK